MINKKVGGRFPEPNDSYQIQKRSTAWDENSEKIVEITTIEEGE